MAFPRTDFPWKNILPSADLNVLRVLMVGVLSFYSNDPSLNPAWCQFFYKVQKTNRKQSANGDIKMLVLNQKCSQKQLLAQKCP